MFLQRKNILVIIAVFIIFVSAIILPVYCQTVDNTFEQLKSELQKEGVSDEFIKSTGNSVKKMLASAAPAADIKTVLLDLWSEGVKGRALKNAVAAVAELVGSGDNTLEAAKIASGAAHKAEAEGLSGFSVGMRVKKAVQERKAYLKTLEK
ncbi:MAG: hypothetical protein PHQ57_01320 [Candidatus Omnitrophica bacterium]|nr:hypothetical protein [Candidatus Omnitrophota bacterium]